MRKLSLHLAIATLTTSPILSFANIYDARAMARGGVGLTMGEYNQSLKNPALLATFDEKDDFSFAFNYGFFASDKDGMLEAADDVQTAIDDLERGTGSASDVNQQLKALDNKMALVDVGGSVLIAIPNQHIPLALMAKNTLSLGILFDYAPTDALQLSTCTKFSCNLNSLNSSISTSAVDITEVGLMFAQSFDIGLDVGATLKGQQIDLITYNATISQFDSDDISDSNNIEKHNHINVDLGALMRFGENKQFSVAATIENAIAKTFDGTKVGGVVTEYELAPIVTTAVGYSSTYFKIEANTDLTARKSFDKLLETQFSRVGVEFSAGRHLHLRAGYRTDMKDNVSDVISAGLGITPFDRLNIDVSAMKGDGDTYGVGLQLGFKI